MRRFLKIFCLSIFTLIVAGLLLMRYVVMPSEGYPSWQAVRNIMQRDGEIRISFPEDVTILHAECRHPQAITSIQGQQVITKIGYAWSKVKVRLKKADGSELDIVFHPQKLNNWNRIHYLPKEPGNFDAGFLKYENGIEKDAHDITFPEQTTDTAQ